jgi:hypothetical protein
VIDNELLKDIEKCLVTNFEKDLFRASIENITLSNSPIRFNNFAYAIRELTRHILARLSPDKKVLKCQWYKNETERENGISRKQRIYFAIHGGLLPTYVQGTLKIDVEEFNKYFRDIVERLNKFTHIERETFGLDEANTLTYINETLETLVEFFDFIDETNETLSNALSKNIQRALIDSILEQTFSKVDILATHHSLEYVHTENLDLIDIDHEFIYFETDGVIEYRMQWGSNSDVRNGDGVVFNKDFPFKCKVHSKVSSPNDILVDIETIEIEADEL